MSTKSTGTALVPPPTLELPCSREAFLAYAASKGWRTETCVHGIDAFSVCNIDCDDHDLGLPAGSDGA